jgi:predicted ATPase
MRLESIRLKNFKIFKDAEFNDLPSLCVLVGANGTGKSTLFQALEFLQIALRENATEALSHLGGPQGFTEVRSRGADGPIEMEIEFRQTQEALQAVYSLSIDEIGGKIVVMKETVGYGPHYANNYLDFEQGAGIAQDADGGQSPALPPSGAKIVKLKSPDLLALKPFSQYEGFPLLRDLGTFIEGWRFSDVEIPRLRGGTETVSAEHLSRQGENLKQVAHALMTRHPRLFDKAVATIKQFVPGLGTVETAKTADHRVLLLFNDAAFRDPFLSDHVSDGTLKALAYLLLQNDPDPHPLLCVEEPENQLYPKILGELAEEFRHYARDDRQVMVATHSPDFLNALRLEEVFWLVKRDGYAQVRRARDDEQLAAYMAEGDQMGYLWRHGFFRGADL